MAPRTIHRLRYALRLVFSVFLLSSPCGGQPMDTAPPASSASPWTTFAAASHRVR
jgi:hypothetical protein